MAITALEANLKDTASTAEGVQAFWALYDRLEQTPGFAFLAEACKESDELHPDFEVAATARGLRLYTEKYDDDQAIKDRHRWVALALGSEVVDHMIIRLGSHRERVRGIGRTAIRVRMHDPESGKDIDFLGAHLSDRSSELNEAQALALLEHTDVSIPTVPVLQTNSMRPWGLWQPALRLAGYFFNHQRQAEPGTPAPRSLLGSEGRKWVPARIASLAARLGGMAEGRSYSLFRNAGFTSDSPLRQRASVYALNRLPIGKVDHIWARGARVRNAKTLNNPLTPTTKHLSEVPHRMVIGEVYVPGKQAS